MSALRCIPVLGRVVERSFHTSVTSRISAALIKLPTNNATQPCKVESPVLASPKLFSMTSPSFARFLHSKGEGEQQFIEFLQQEIGAEKDSKRKLPKISGFTVETKGPEVKLTKKHGSETVTVEFNVSNSVSTWDSDDAPELEDPENKEVPPPELQSEPPFTVTMSKEGSSKKLSVKCELIDDIMSAEANPEDVDSYQITEVAMIDDVWTDQTYSVNAELMDGSMYDMMMLMLEQRGITHDTFCDEFVEFSTAYEQKLYVDMLESLKEYVQQ